MGKLNGNARSRLIRKKVIPIFAAIVFSLFWLSTRTINALWSKQFSLGGNVSLGSWSFTPTPSPFHPVDPGTTLRASLTASANLNPIEDGDSKKLTQSYGLKGEVCISNRGAYPTQDLTIVASIQSQQREGRFQNLLVFPVGVGAQPALSPGEQYCYPYDVTFEALVDANARFRIGASITITNYSGWTPGSENCPGTDVCPYGPWVTTRFTLPIPPTERVEPTRTPLPTRDDSKQETPRPTSTASPSSTTTATLTKVPDTATPPVESRWTPTLALTTTPTMVPTTAPTAKPDDTPTPQLTNTPQPESRPTIEPKPAVDLAIDHLEEPFTASAGTVIVYQLSYANLGAAAASGVVITTALPEHTSFNPEMNSPGWSQADSLDGYIFGVGDLSPGASGTVLFAVQVDDLLPDELQTIANTASISDDGSQGVDLAPGNNTSTSQVPVENS